MKTTFETAIDKHEIPDFFKGNGIYFARGSDWGDHPHKQLAGDVQCSQVAEYSTDFADDAIRRIRQQLKRTLRRC